jgi:DNA replicative helicase MCM subunit Mcm2 (Cdc46/Mcm family)
MTGTGSSEIGLTASVSTNHEIGERKLKVNA